MIYLVCDDAQAPRESAASTVEATTARASAERRLVDRRAAGGTQVAVRAQGHSGPWTVFSALIQVSAREVGSAGDCTIRRTG